MNACAIVENENTSFNSSGVFEIVMRSRELNVQTKCCLPKDAFYILLVINASGTKK